MTGVTGSGKSTTISALVNHINLYRKTRIITLEDPVEFLFKSESSMVSQRQVGQGVTSFSGGLRSALLGKPGCDFRRGNKRHGNGFFGFERRRNRALGFFHFPHQGRQGGR